jgi:hypothetical protein
LDLSSDAFNPFINFKNLVERKLDRKILTIQSDWGAEDVCLNAFFKTHGISHHVSCPMHINKMALLNKKHHVVEVGLTHISNDHMHLKFWEEVFPTATYLINMLPSRVICNDAHVHHLLHTKLVYSPLHVFGCECWSNLHPYNKHNLAFCSK